MNIEKTLEDFDIVRSHYFDTIRTGVCLPLKYDADNFNKAHQYALMIAKLGLLEEFSARIQLGLV